MGGITPERPKREIPSPPRQKPTERKEGEQPKRQGGLYDFEKELLMQEIILPKIKDMNEIQRNTLSLTPQAITEIKKLVAQRAKFEAQKPLFSL